MFSRGHGKPKKEANTKKHHIRNWMHSKKKKKHEANLFAVIMSSGDTPASSPAQASISTMTFDTVDDAKLEKKEDLGKTVILPMTSMKPAKSREVIAATDPEAIEVAIPLLSENQCVSGDKSKIENGIDIEKRKEEPHEEIEDECLIDCIYYMQECCLCTIL